MDISPYYLRSAHHEEVDFTGWVVGAGASAPTVPSDKDNLVESATRSGVGVYAIVLKEGVPKFLHAVPTIIASDGVLKHAVVTSVVESTKTINVKCWSAAPTVDQGITSGEATSSDPAEIAAGATGTATLTVPDAEVGDIVFVHPQALAVGLVMVSYIVTGADEVTVTLLNPTAAPINDTAQDYEYLLVKNNGAEPTASVPVAVDIATTDTLKFTFRARNATD